MQDGVTIEPLGSLKNLAFDHDKILAYALKRLQAKLAYTNIAYSLLGESFTLTELQNIYETILNKQIDKRNFRKKILSLGIIVETQKILKGKQYRPARLYKFKEKTPTELDSPAF